MSNLFNILHKSIVIPFYRSHAGLLIFVFLIMFGTVESNQLVNYHRTLILGMFSSEIFMFAVCFVWALYSVKILHYIISLLKKSEYAFLTNMILVSKSKAFVYLLLVAIFCFLPVLVYSVFIYQLGITQYYYTSTAAIFSFQTVLCCLNASVILLFLRTQHKSSWTFAKIRIPNIGGRTGFYISHFISEEKVALLISKTFSLALLYIVREATEAGDDFRILALTWVFVLLSHTFLVLKVRMFEDRYMNWVRSLPISTAKTCGVYFIFYAGLLLPELIFSMSMIENSYEPLLLMLFSGGLLLFIHAYLLKANRDPEKFSTFLFWLFILSFFALLSKLIIALIVVLIALACLRIIQRYYEYESA